MRTVFSMNDLNSQPIDKLAQNTRLDIIGELDAIMQYENHISSSADATYRNTLIDILNEEKLHVGQLFGLLFMLDPTSKEQFEKGLNEFTSQNRTNNNY